MTTITITPTLRLTVIKHLASGKTPDVVATIAGIPRESVVDIGSHHGYPDRDKLSWAVDILAKKAQEGEQATITARPDLTVPAPARPAARPTTPRPVPAADAPSTAAAETGVTQEEETGVEALLTKARDHSSKRIQSAAARVDADLAKLQQLLDDDEAKHAACRKAEAEKAAARAEVERLEQQLADAKAKLRRGTTKPKSTTPRSTAPKGEYPCRNDGCAKVYDTPQGRSMHERLRCEHRTTAGDA